jgi:hypothetical protein
MEMTALNQLANFKSRVDAKLEYMMNNHSNFVLEARIKAPVIIVSNGKSDMLVLDLGFLQLKTEKLAKVEHEKSMNEARSRSSVVGSEEITPQLQKCGSFNLLEREANMFSDLNTDESYSIAEDLEEELLKEISTDGAYPDSPDERDESIEKGTDGSHSPLNRSNNTGSIYTGTENDGTSSTDNESLYDVLQLSITNIEVYMLNTDKSLDNGISQSNTRNTLADKFDISVEIQLSVLPWDTTLPPIKLFVNLPEIIFR